MKIEWLVSIWLVWAALVLLFQLWVVTSFRPRRNAHYNGFFIVISPDLPALLTERELAAVIEHEKGHRRCLHIWYNVFRMLTFAPITVEELQDQELEADDLVEDYEALARALRKIGCATSFDVFRTERLERRARLAGRGQPNTRVG